MKTPRIQGEVLEWALQDAGVDRAQVLAHLTTENIPVSGKIAGPINLPLEDLKEIAKATRRSTYFFARPYPPAGKKESISANFRAPASNDGTPRPLNPDERAAIRHARRRQEIASKLSESFQADAIELLRINPSTPPQDAAKQVAEWLKWDRRNQYTVLKSKTKVFVALREALESRGILTNLIKVEGVSFRGFTLHHTHAPLIFINAAQKSPAARSFTLLHELAHLLQGVDKACGRHDLQSRSSAEAWCNKFAAAFLMPADDLKTYMQKHLKTGWVLPGDEYSLGRISNYFKSSWYCTAIRLKEEGFADDNLVQSVSGDFQDPEKPGRAPGKTRPELRLTEFGQGFAQLIDTGISGKLVSEMEARKLFRVDGSELRTLMRLCQGAD